MSSDSTATSMPVVIIGGGPVGLAASAMLAKKGVQCMVVEQRTTPSCGQSRAVTIQRDIVALYDRLGIVDEILEFGSSWSLGRTYYGDDEVLQLRFAKDDHSVYPPFVNFAQYRLEELLHELATRYENVQVLHGSSAVVVNDGANSDHAVVEVTSNDGETTLLDAAYVIAADGVRSSTRKALGIEYDGWRTNGRFLVADFRAPLPFTAERRLWFSPPFHPEGIVLMHNIGNGVWRLDWQISADLDVDRELETGGVTRRIRAVLDHAGVADDIDIEVVRCNGWTFQQRQADRFRQGRVFLAGDAAHVVSPFGARGMNSGMEDVENLAWKMTMVLSGEAPDALLNSYALEREVAAAHNVQVTGESMKFMVPGTPEGLAARNKVLEQAAADPTKGHLVNSGKLYHPHPYTDSPLTSTSNIPAHDGLTEPGHMVPDFRLGLSDGVTTVRKMVDHRFTVIAVDGATPAELRFFRIDEAGVSPSEVARPADGSLAPHPLQHTQGVVHLVRPDCYIAATIEVADASDMSGWAHQVTAAWHRSTARELDTAVSV